MLELLIVGLVAELPDAWRTADEGDDVEEEIDVVASVLIADFGKISCISLESFYNSRGIFKNFMISSVSSEVRRSISSC